MNVKIKDVAAAAGVSVATVSRVLSNGPVSQSLRQRVEYAVTQLGYRPNLSARRLRSQHSQTVGLIVSDIRNPFFTAVSRAVEHAAYQADMRVILCNSDENPQKEAWYLRLMQEERISGVIFSPTSITIKRFRPEHFSFPIVLIDRIAEAGLTDSIVLDNRAATYQLVNHLIEMGYSHIGGLFGNSSTTGTERCAGYEWALHKSALPSFARFIQPSAEAAKNEVLRWLMQDNPPDALLASNGLLLLGALRALHEKKLNVPEDIALCGFDNEIWTGLVGDGLTVIEQPVDDIGSQAMQMLLSRLENPALSKRCLVLNGTLRIRGSTTQKLNKKIRCHFKPHSAAS